MGVLRITITIFILIFLMTGCSSEEKTEVLDPAFIISEDSLPNSFENLDVQYVVKRFNHIEEFITIWNNFQNESELTEKDFATIDVLFLGLYESSTCPYYIEKIQANYDQNEIEVHLFVEDENCSSDAKPRSFILGLDKNQTKDLTTLVIVYGLKRVPIEIHTVD